ncbi:Dolichyl-diphosphooligosaccharide-protein glycosyltransferase subunit dad1 [Coemansia aciculifera]|uniref:Dolichyl-diphosphooligosaccharide-protein glycosyltransferase subunit dad1 n=1 Tax=Coemansia aciculifera TaxID=417176 RepID=A0ACC1M290_9FUNG|nr:Dolichyl-diphosphooligosaccharide-protein glycosyltransferase subunit dad1 [Coemansia aciculifera]KAJ2908012.1 Dolichyl-diphosphooligosaccharide-protein glycosyltransferase subunit dad1 [Coemansia aciculifera]
MSASTTDILSRLAHDYTTETPLRLKAIDAYMVFCVAVGVAQFAYCLLVGTFPYNAFLAGFGSAVACFVFAANLRIKTNVKNAAQFAGTPEGAFAEFVFCHITLHFIVANFLG